jgi:hypothetical protein
MLMNEDGADRPLSLERNTIISVELQMKKLLIVLAFVLLPVVASAKPLPSRPVSVPLTPAVMQTVPDVNNPSAVTFTPSTDHAAIDSYEMDILRPDGTVLQTLNLGKPAPNASNECVAQVNVQPVGFGTGYSVRVRALAGTAASDYAVSVNKFNRVPGGPTKVRIGG